MAGGALVARSATPGRAIVRGGRAPRARRLRGLGRAARRSAAGAARLLAPGAVGRRRARRRSSRPRLDEHGRAPVVHEGDGPPRGRGLVSVAGRHAGGRRPSGARRGPPRPGLRPVQGRRLPARRRVGSAGGDPVAPRRFGPARAGMRNRTRRPLGPHPCGGGGRDPVPAVRKKAGWYAPGGSIHRRTAPRPMRAGARQR
jgi:hypothetical protein